MSGGIIFVICKSTQLMLLFSSKIYVYDCINCNVIRPFCIMLLYRYLLHYGLLLHIMSQYLCLFSLILQGLHEEGEYRQLEYWAGKGANIRDLFCIAPKVLKLHGRRFQNI